MIDFTAFSAALNKVIMPAIESQVYHRAPMWQLLGGWSAEESVATRANARVDHYENNLMYIPTRSSVHSGIVSVGVGESYNYGQPTLNTTNQPIRTIVGSFTIEKQLLNTTNAGSIVKPLTYYSEALGNDLAMDCNRQVYGDASGTLATTAGTGTSTTALVLAPSVNGNIDYSRYMPVGTLLKIGGNAQVSVTAVTGDNAVTISSAQSWSAGAAVIKQTGSGTASGELDGLATMVKATGVYQALDAANDNTWKASVDSTTEAILTSTILPKMAKQYFAANKTGKVDWIVMNSNAFQMYGNSLQSQIRFTQKEVLAGGWAGLDYMGGMAQILLDYDCPDDKIYFLSSEDAVFGQFQPFQFEQGTDGTLLKIAQQLNYEVTASWMGNIGTVGRNTNALMANKTF